MGADSSRSSAVRVVRGWTREWLSCQAAAYRARRPTPWRGRRRRLQVATITPEHGPWPYQHRWPAYPQVQRGDSGQLPEGSRGGTAGPDERREVCIEAVNEWLLGRARQEFQRLSL